MAISRRVLYEGEKVLLDIRPHWTSLLGPFTVALVVVAAALALDIGFVNTSPPLHWAEAVVAAIPCAWLVVRFVRWRRTSLILTNVRVIERFGVVFRRGAQILLSDVVRVDARQTLLRRLVGTGSLVIEVGDGGVYRFSQVRKPVAFQRAVISGAASLRPFPVERQEDWPTDPGQSPRVPRPPFG